MALFACHSCGCVEDTALCRYWSSRLRQLPAVCSGCDPAIGKWHGEFPQQSALGWFAGEDGVLSWSKSEVEEWLGTEIQIVGRNSPAAPPLAETPGLK